MNATEKPQTTPENTGALDGRGLVKKLAEVMALVNRIPKTGYNDRQNYHYVTESDVMDCIRGGLAERGVIITHEVVSYNPEWRESKSGGAMQFCTVSLDFTAWDVGGARLPLGKGYGQGQDSGEKAIYKAITGATKYKLLKTFLMSSGDDPEAEKKPIHAQRDPAAAGGPRPGPAPAAAATFPSFGPAKGAPVRDAKPEHLNTYLEAARKSLADPANAKWHAKESARIGAYEAELARQRGLAPEGKRETAKAAPENPPPPAGPKMLDVLPGESEEHAKMRNAGAFYAQAIKLGASNGWDAETVGKWLRRNFGRGGKHEVTEADVMALMAVVHPPQEPGANG